MQRPIQLVLQNLRTGHYRSAFSLSRKPVESVDIVQARVCSCCKILTSDRAFQVYVPYPRNLITGKWEMVFAHRSCEKYEMKINPYR
ncbi:hypothetical protein PUN28_007467 [Cardiocondyla obscurior]|uniref:Uncharacterized protein n=1 Tax=Cardiocondyla obscurior TaxID=286306 RepID=A0AAW2G6E4_9HYME